VPLDYFFKYEKWFFFLKRTRISEILFFKWNPSKKKTSANFRLFVVNCGKILFYNLIFIYFFKYETIVRFDVYACLDCNCWKRITVQWEGQIMSTKAFEQYLNHLNAHHIVDLSSPRFLKFRWPCHRYTTSRFWIHILVLH
jgi:hypothetical protein